MSNSAPWLALSIDWSDSEMLDNSSHGVRLAWVELLCWTKAQGRAGKVRLRVPKFAEQKRLSVESVEEMLVRATNAGAVTRQGDELTICNWRRYQDPSRRTADDNANKGKDLGNHRTHFTKNDATEHRAPSTEHPSPNHRAPPAARVSKRSRLTAESLANVEMLRAWFDDESARTDAKVDGSERTWANVKAAAAKVLTDLKVRDKVAVAKWIIFNRRWEYLSCGDEDAAKVLLSGKFKPTQYAVDLAAMVQLKPTEHKPTTQAEALRQLRSVVGEKA